MAKYHYTVRTPDAIGVRIEAFKTKRNIHQDSHAINYLLKAGLDVTEIMTTKTEYFGLPVEIVTAIDKLTSEQEKVLVKLMLEKMNKNDRMILYGALQEKGDSD